MKSKPDRKMKHAPLPYWNEDCKNALNERNRARNKLNHKSRRKMLKTTKD